ncbi:MAG: polyprenyl synthetase family protein [Polyangiaceae bacterium]
MNDPLEEAIAPELAARGPVSLTARLLELLEQQFSPRALEAMLGRSGVEAERALWRSSLYGPLHHFLSRPGKALRATLVDASYRIAGGRGQCPVELGLIVEVLHAGSLIIDDIEDGSLERRGAPALHCEIGLPLALNAGNWLYFWACALVERLELGPHAELGVHRWLSRTMLSCHYGQALDLELRVGEVTQERVRSLVDSATRLKTGCLVQLAAALGAIAAGAQREHVSALAGFGLDLGVSLQMLDDLSGLTSKRRLHKGLEDLREGRPTWPWAWLADSLDEATFAELQARSRELTLGSEADASRRAEELALKLEAALGASGRVHIREHGRVALARLVSRLGTAVALTQAAALVRELEQAYG